MKPKGFVVLRIVSLIAVFGLGYYLGYLNAPPKSVEEAFIGWYTVERVVDGDTIVVKGRRIRYIGVDTPETKHPKKGAECFGEEAFKRNEHLVSGRKVYLEGDVDNLDQNERPLRYVWLEDKKMVNLILIEEGYGRERYIYPNKKYREKFKEAEHTAEATKNGLWGACKVGEKIEKQGKTKKLKPGPITGRLN